MRRKQCKIGVLALLLLAEYGFAQTKDSLSKENAIKEVVVVAFGKQKRRNHRICAIFKSQRPF